MGYSAELLLKDRELNYSTETKDVELTGNDQTVCDSWNNPGDIHPLITLD